MSALSIIDPQGEVVEDVVDAPRLLRAFGIGDLSTAPMLDLVVARDALRELRSITSEADSATDGELVVRCTRSMAFGTSALELADGTKVSTDPPDKDKVYDDARLDALLARLLDAGTIDQIAADKVRVPVPGTVAIPDDVLCRLILALSGVADSPEVEALSALLRSYREDIPAMRPKTDRNGVNALRKLSKEIADEVDACRVDAPGPTRKAKVVRPKRPMSAAMKAGSL